MVSVNPSSLIGAQAYAVQLRRQYGQEETARAFNPDDRQTGRADRQARRAAAIIDRVQNDRVQNEGNKPAPATDLAKAITNSARVQVAGNPTVGEVSPRPNPPARPLFSSTTREAPNPNAQLRNIRPGTHLDITI